MATRTPKRYLWRVVENTSKSVDVVAETELDAIGLYYQCTEEGSKYAERIDAQKCYDIEAYELDVKPTSKERGIHIAEPKRKKKGSSL